MKKIIEAITGVLLILLVEISFTVILFRVLRKILLVNYNALWIGCCVLIGSLFLCIMIASLVGVIQEDG